MAEDGGASGGGGAPVPSPSAPRTAFFRSLKFRLLLLVILGMVPFLALLLQSNFARREAALRSSGREVKRLARVASRYLEESFEHAQRFLETVARDPEVASGSAGERSAFLGELLKRTPGYLDFRIAGPDGKVVASALEPAASAAVADGDCLQAALRTKLVVVGAFRTGKKPGSASVDVARPILSPSGEVVSVLWATLDLAALGDFQRRFQLPTDSLFQVLAARGTVLVSYPVSVEGFTGRPHPVPELGKGGPYDRDEVDPVTCPDGMARLFGFEPLRTGGAMTGTMVVLGIPMEAIVGSRGP